MEATEVRKELALAEYETLGGRIQITLDDVKNYLAKGNSQLTDKEAILFLQLCKSQKLNPWTGEAYPIKFGGDFQMVVGYETYKRRAEDNPEYIGRKSGIVVLRGNEVIQKEGTCLYPGEQLVGGWCRVYRMKRDKEDETFKEVSLKEYDKGQANWKTKPCTMIEKVAVSQALRAAFPKDFEGMYTESEMGTDIDRLDETNSLPDGTVTITDADGKVVQENEEGNPEADDTEAPAKHGEIIRFLDFAKYCYGDRSNEMVQEVCSNLGILSLKGISKGDFIKAVDAFNNMAKYDGMTEIFEI